MERTDYKMVFLLTYPLSNIPSFLSIYVYKNYIYIERDAANEEKGKISMGELGIVANRVQVVMIIVADQGEGW